MARRGRGFWVRLVVGIIKPTMTVWTRRTWTGMEHIPATGGVILAANHASHFDPLVYAHYVYDAGRWPQFLAKASIFRVPVVGWLLRQVRQIPVERGSVEAARSLDTLIAELNDGASVIIYPEGTTTKDPDMWPMRGKTGAARLALVTGAPVIPVAMWGAHRIFDPRTGKLSLRLRQPVSVTAGPPVDLSRWQGAAPSRAVLDEMTDEIMLRIRDLVGQLRGATPPPLFVPPGRQAGGETPGGQPPAAEETPAGTGPAAPQDETR